MQTETIETKQQEDNFPKIYVACLSSYNAGKLYGKWIVPANNETELDEQIKEVLKKSPMPDAEEWAIHDYDEFPNLGENPSFENIVNCQVAIEEHGIDVVNGFLENWQVEDLNSIDDAYYGEYNSFSEFAEQLADDTVLVDCPENVKWYFDYEKWERDLSYDYHEAEGKNGNTIIFSTNF